MVEINNQRKAFLDMLMRSEGTDNGRQKTRNHGYDVIVKSYLIIIRSPSQTCHAKPKTQINAFLMSSASSRWWVFWIASSLPERLLLKSQTLWHCSRLRSVALYL